MEPYRKFRNFLSSCSIRGSFDIPVVLLLAVKSIIGGALSQYDHYTASARVQSIIDDALSLYYWYACCCTATIYIA